VYAPTQSKVFDNRSPRTYAQNLEKDQIINKETKARILRAESAQSNGFENLALFATPVLAGNLAGLSAQTLNTLSIGYPLSRQAYNFFILTILLSEGMANLRSVVFLAGVGQIFTLSIMSGNSLREKAANLL
ncbi:uncharacterized protein K444DRAFT_520701, partial [Hyaloscypha bicolor E]